MAIEAVLDLLGWCYKAMGDKAPDFGPVFGALGVVFDVSTTIDSAGFDVKNKPEHAANVFTIFKEIEEAGVLRPAVANMLRSMLQSWAGQAFGWSGARGLHALSQLRVRHSRF